VLSSNVEKVDLTIFRVSHPQLGRETARLLQAFGVNIIAANSSGKATVDDGVSGGDVHSDETKGFN
jgi:hypothetical protein